MANVVEITIRGVDEATRVFRDIQGTADRVFSDVESAIESVPDLDIDANVDTGRAERNISGIEGAVGEAESAIKSLPDPDIDSSKAEAELDEVGDSAEDAQKKIEKIDFGAVIGGIAAGGGIAGAVEKALDIENLNTQIEIAFDIPDESVTAVKDSIKTVQSYGVDAENALEGVRRQFALNANASDESNQKVIEGAGAIASAYSEIDFTELIQEANEIGNELNITTDEALGLTNNLLKIGFPPGEVDIIAEYGKQLTEAGYSAEEVQGIIQAGVETGTWNIDNLLDGLKEGRILIGEFGSGIDDATAELLEGTGISSEQLQTWGQQVSAGGEQGKQAMQEVASALENVEDATKRNELGVKLFGTLYEDQGANITDTLLNAEKLTGDLEEGQKGVNDAVSAMNANPAVQMEQAMQSLNASLAPLYSKVAKVVSAIATWVSENPQLAGTMTAISVVLGIVTGALMALGPVINGAKIAMGLFNTTLLANPITWVIAGITALIAIGVLLWKNWDAVSENLSKAWNFIREKATDIFGGLSDWFSETWDAMKAKASEVWNSISEYFSELWISIKETFHSTMDSIKESLSEAWNSMKEDAVNVWNSITEFFTGLWEGIVNLFHSAVESIQAFLTGAWTLISNVIQAVWTGIGVLFSTIWQGIVTVVTTYINIVQTVVTTVFNAIRTVITTIWNGISNIISAVWSGIVTIVQAYINLVRTSVTTGFNVVRTIIETVWNAIKMITSNTWNVIVNVIQTILSRLRSAFTTVFNVYRNIIVNVWNAVKNITSNVWGSIRSVINSIINTIRSTISSTFNSIQTIISNVWNGVKNTTSKVWNSMVGLIRTPVNSIIRIINGMINAINGVNIKLPKVPDWVPGIGGKGGGSIGFNIPNVPSLATGGVVHRPTLAMVGDAGHGNPEIVTPQKMMAETFRKELNRMIKGSGGNNNDGNNGNNLPTEIVVPIYLEGREIARATAPYMDRELGERRSNTVRSQGRGR